MQLRTSFFNGTVYKKNLTRFAPVWLCYTLCLILGMVLMYTNGGNTKNYWFASHMAEMIPIMGLVNLAYALLVAQLLFGDLFNSRMCNALHAMPLRREGWFFTHVLSGLTFSMVPTAVMSALSLPLLAGSLFSGAWKLGFYFFAAANLQYLCFFGIAVFSVMVTGNRFTMVAGYGMINFGACIVYWLIDTLYTPMLYGVITPTALMENLTPLLHMTDQQYAKFETLSKLQETFGTKLENATATFQLTGEWWRLFACAGVGIAFALAALLLYRIRDLECAGDAVAFKVLVPAFQIPCAIVVAAAAQFFLENFLNVYGYNFLVMGAGLIVGWFAGKMLIERTTRVFRLKNWYGLIGLTAAIALTLLATYADILGIEDSQPNLEDIKSISFGTSYTANTDLTEEADFEAILRLQRLALEDQVEDAGAYVEENGQLVKYNLSEAYQAYLNSDDAKEPDLERVYAAQVVIYYELDNGKLIKRRYNIWADEEEGDITRQIMSRWEVVAHGSYGEETKDRLSWILNSFKSINYNTYETEASTQYQTVEDAKSFLEAVKADCAAGLMAQDPWLHHGHFRYEDATREEGYRTRDGIYVYIQGEKYSWYVDVYPDSVNTVRWLQERGLLGAEVRTEDTLYR